MPQILLGYHNFTISHCNRNDLLHYAGSSYVPMLKLTMSVKKENVKLTWHQGADGFGGLLYIMF